MRVLILTALILVPLYYLNKDNKASVDFFGTSDEVKLKSSAPKRPILKRKVVSRKASEAPSYQTKKIVRDEKEMKVDQEHFDEYDEKFEVGEEAGRSPAVGSLESGWNAALLDLLNRLEPADAQTIYDQYIGEQDAYQAEFEALMAEKQQNPHNEEAFRTEEAVAQLDHIHEQRLQEILGAHYEAVKDYYEGYMDAAEVEEAND